VVREAALTSPAPTAAAVAPKARAQAFALRPGGMLIVIGQLLALATPGV
jgi:hypothetical protein